jgi:glycerol-3-phosphate dehydrogenase
MGQCQGNFCQPRVRALIARELGIAEEEVTKRGAGSSILPKRVERKEYRKLNS